MGGQLLCSTFGCQHIKVTHHVIGTVRSFVNFTTLSVPPIIGGGHHIIVVRDTVTFWVKNLPLIFPSIFIVQGFLMAHLMSQLL